MNVKILIILIIADIFEKCNRFGGFCLSLPYLIKVWLSI